MQIFQKHIRGAIPKIYWPQGGENKKSLGITGLATRTVKDTPFKGTKFGLSAMLFFQYMIYAFSIWYMHMHWLEEPHS